MISIEELGWGTCAAKELDHRLLKAPSMKLRSARVGEKGDVVYCVDLRLRHPKANEYLSTTELHSLEHFLLEGFQRHLPSNFISVGVMGCQTGFYLVFLNEGRAKKICGTLEDILTDLLGASRGPYARIDQCGNYRNHSLKLAQKVARKVLEAKSAWLEAA